MTYSTVEGINKVLSSRGDYAFILSSDLIDYKVDETNITLTVTNEANKQTVITFPLNSFTF